MWQSARAGGLRGGLNRRPLDLCQNVHHIGDGAACLVDVHWASDELARRVAV